MTYMNHIICSKMPIYCTRCSSFIGKQSGAQEIKLGVGCVGTRPAHEIMHALGCFHKQSWPDRDLYVKINVDNIHKYISVSIKSTCMEMLLSHLINYVEPLYKKHHEDQWKCPSKKRCPLHKLRKLSFGETINVFHKEVPFIKRWLVLLSL